MNKKIIVILTAILIVGLILGISLYFGVFNKNKTAIKKLNVDLEKYQIGENNTIFENEIKGKMVQIAEVETYIGDKTRYVLILLNDGSVYLSDRKLDNIIKLEGKVELSRVEGSVDSPIDTEPMIYGDGKYYQIGKNGDIKLLNYDFKNIVKYYYIPDDNKTNNGKTNYLQVLEKDGKLIIYKNNQGFDINSSPKDSSWVRYEPEHNTYLDRTFKFANDTILLTDDNKLYEEFYFSTVTLNPDKLTYSSSYKTPEPLMVNVSNLWGWENAKGHPDRKLVVQTQDNKIYFNFSSLIEGFENEIQLSEKIENLYFDDVNNFLITTESSVYLCVEGYGYNDKNDYGKKYELKELSNLKEYKDEIRDIHTSDSITYVLLSDGNLYKAYEW